MFEYHYLNQNSIQIATFETILIKIDWNTIKTIQIEIFRIPKIANHISLVSCRRRVLD